MADLYTAVMAIPGADKALGFLQTQAAAFAYVPARLETIRRQLEAVRTQAATRNDAATVAKVAGLLAGLPQLQSLYANASGQVSQVMSALQTGAMDPFGLVPKLLGAAAQVTLVFKSVDLFEQGTKAVAAGTLTAAQLAQLRQGGYTPAGLAPTLFRVALVVGGVWLGWRLLRGRR